MWHRWLGCQTDNCLQLVVPKEISKFMTFVFKVSTCTWCACTCSAFEVHYCTVHYCTLLHSNGRAYVYVYVLLLSLSHVQLIIQHASPIHININALRVVRVRAGTSSPPISAAAHDNAVHGIAVDPSSDRSFLFASFSRGLAEPVKLWDMRRMESCVAEIKMYHHSSDKYAGTGIASHDLPSVSAVAWDTSESQSGSGVLSIASSDSMRFYDTRINPSRPSLTRMTNSQNAIQSIAFQPPRTKYRSDSEGVSSSMQRMLVVEVDGSVRDLPFHQVAPVAISSRDGRISNSVGSVVWVGATTEGKLFVHVLVEKNVC